MFCILQTVFPTFIFHFQFSIFNLKSPFGNLYFRFCGTISSKGQRWHTADINFPFSIFHFQFEISVRESLFSLLRNYLLKLTAVAHRVYCTVTVIVTLDVLLSTSVTEYVTLYLPLRVVTTLPTTLISDEMSLPQVSTAVTPVSA